MKKLFFLLLTISMAFSCSKESKNNENDMASIELSFQPAGNTLLKSATDTSLDIASAIISIQNEKGELVYNNEEVKVYKMGDYYISKPLSVKVGTYKVIRFFLANLSGNVIYASPLKESNLNYMVKNALPISFSVSKDQVLKLSPEVLPAKEFTPMDFGYSTFSFNIINPINFQLAVFEYSEVAKNFVLTDAKLQITTIDSFSYQTSLQAKTNMITIPEKKGYYSLIISKTGYTVYNKSISKDSIKLYVAKPMEVILTKEGASPSLVAFYKFYGNLTDLSGYGNHGLYYGRGLYANGRSSDSISSIDLNGSADYIKIQNSVSLNMRDQVSICAWYKTTGFEGNGHNPIISKSFPYSSSQRQVYSLAVTGNQYPNNTSGFGFAIATENLAYGLHTTGYGAYGPGDYNKYFTYSLDKWYFLVGTYDGAIMKLYVDGDLKASKEITGKLVDCNNDLFIGKSQNTTRTIDYLPGKIDEIRVYNIALTLQEIVNLYDLK